MTHHRDTHGRMSLAVSLYGGEVGAVHLVTFLQAGTGARCTDSFMGIFGRVGGKRQSRLGRDSPFVVE